MVNPERILEAFKRHKLKPLANNWAKVEEDTVYCCGLMALWLDTSFTINLHILKNTLAGAIHTLRKELNLKPSEFYSFLEGWDGQVVNKASDLHMYGLGLKSRYLVETLYEKVSS